MSDFDQLLNLVMDDAASAFEANELAFLALTSKPEQHFRDRIAFALYNRVGTEGLIVCREWNRTDLAVLDTQGIKPVFLLERFHAGCP